MKTSKVYLEKKYVSKEGYANCGKDYFGYDSKTAVYQAIWEETHEGREYSHCEYFRAVSREECKKQVIRYITYNGLIKIDIKFYR